MYLIAIVGFFKQKMRLNSPDSNLPKCYLMPTETFISEWLWLILTQDTQNWALGSKTHFFFNHPTPCTHIRPLAEIIRCCRNRFIRMPQKLWKMDIEQSLTTYFGWFCMYYQIPWTMERLILINVCIFKACEYLFFCLQFLSHELLVFDVWNIVYLI